MKMLMKKIAFITIIAFAAIAVGTTLVKGKTSETRAALSGDGAKLYRTNCASCHGADGSGNTPIGKKLGAKPLRQARGDVAGVIKNGRGKMPGFGKRLNDSQIQELVQYIRSM